MSALNFKIKKEAMTLMYGYLEEVNEVLPDQFEWENVTVIETNAFELCPNAKFVEEIKLPNNLEIIGGSVFRYFKSLKKIELPETVKELKQFAFADCVLVEEIVFPESVEKVGPSAFQGCISLKKIVVKNPETKFSSTTFQGCTALEEVSFHILKLLPMNLQCKLVVERLKNMDQFSTEEQEEIVAYLKKKAALRKEIFLSGDVVAISFLMSQKTKMTLEMVEEFLKKSIDENNTEATAIFLDYKNKNFSKNKLEDYNNNKELVAIGLELPTLKQFKEKWKCGNVEGGIVISEYKGNETHEVIPAQLADGKKIVELRKMKSGRGAPIDTGTLTHLTIEAPITSLTSYAFHGSKLESITLPDTLETVGSDTFSFCTELKKMVLPPNIKIIPRNLFLSCQSLEELVLPEHLEEIQIYAFRFCGNLKMIHFPNKEVIVEKYAFHRCPSLGDAQGFLIFQGVLHEYYGTDDFVVIPDTVQKVADSAFEKCNCKEIVLPDSVKIIAFSAFASSGKLEKVVFPDHLEAIGTRAFGDTPSLQKVTLPRGVKLGEKVFDAKVTINWK